MSHNSESPAQDIQTQLLDTIVELGRVAAHLHRIIDDPDKNADSIYQAQRCMAIADAGTHGLKLRLDTLAAERTTQQRAEVTKPDDFDTAVARFISAA